MKSIDYRGWHSCAVLERLPWETLRFETIEEGHRRAMKVLHLPTGIAVEGVGDHVSRRGLREQLLPKLLELVQAHVAAQRNGNA